MIIYIYLFSSITIEGYYKYFLFYKYLYILTNCLKVIFILNGTKYISEIIKLLETIILTNIFLIFLSDPYYNTEKIPNLVNFNEVYFRYLEFHILIFSLYFLYNDKNIENEINNKIYSFSSIIGRYDSFRFFTVLNLIHYIFIVINGLSFSLR